MNQTEKPIAVIAGCWRVTETTCQILTESGEEKKTQRNNYAGFFFFFFGSHLHLHLGSIVRARAIAPQRKRPKSREIFKLHLNDSFRYLPKSVNGF